MRDIFDLYLDTAQENSRAVYKVLKSLFAYPDSIDDYNDQPNLDGLYYQAAFAFLCGEYIQEISEIKPNDDFQHFVEQSGIEEILKEDTLFESEDDKTEIAWNAIQERKSVICEDISKLFPTEELQLRLFASLDVIGEYASAHRFVSENFTQKPRALKIGSEEKKVCKEIIQQALDVGRFTKQEFALLEKVYKWLDYPVADFIFSFTGDLKEAGESFSFYIEFDGDRFELSEFHGDYDPAVGGDTFCSYQYFATLERAESSGNLSSFKGGFLGLLNQENKILKIS